MLNILLFVVVQCPKPRIEDIIQLLGNNEQYAYDVGTRLKFSCRDIEQTIEGYDEITCRRMEPGINLRQILAVKLNAIKILSVAYGNYVYV